MPEARDAPRTPLDRGTGTGSLVPLFARASYRCRLSVGTRDSEEPCRMPLVRCNGCSERPSDKMSQVTWAWRRADGARKAYRGRLCTACFATKVAPLSIDYSGSTALTCPSCGIGTEEDMDAVYTTSYLPSYGEFRTESPFCGACAATYRIWVQEHSWELEDQRGASGGPSTHPSADEILRSLGIEPRRAQ